MTRCNSKGSQRAGWGEQGAYRVLEALGIPDLGLKAIKEAVRGSGEETSGSDSGSL